MTITGDRERQRTRIGDGKETGLSPQKETANGARICGARNKELAATGKGNRDGDGDESIVGVEFDFDFTWVAEPFSLPFCCSHFIESSIFVFRFFPSALLTVFLLVFLFFFLLSTNAANKCKATTYDFSPWVVYYISALCFFLLGYSGNWIIFLYIYIFQDSRFK